MATHDYIIDNQSAPAFRADLNNALAAIASQNASAVAPTVTFANMIWYDTSTNQIKKRNEANSNWIVLGTVDETAGTFTPSGLPPVASLGDAQSGTGTGLMNATLTAAAIEAQVAADLTVFTASGTWTKPTGYPDDTKVVVELWGAGGGGARSGTGRISGGGGGGGYTVSQFALADLPSSVSVTIGAGGTGRTGSSGAGTDGGNSTFGSLLTAYGGAGGLDVSSGNGGGGGGGELTKGTGANGGSIGGGSSASPAKMPFGGGGGGNANGSGGAAIYGGGGGGGGGNGNPGGVSLFGGGGGVGGDGSPNASAGLAPAGGGGGGINVNGANGARGEVRIWIG